MSLVKVLLVVSAAVLAAPALATAKPSGAVPAEGMITNPLWVGNGLEFSGRLTSSLRICTQGRRVVLDRAGPSIVGRAASDGNGHWTIFSGGWSNVKQARFWAWVRVKDLHRSYWCDYGAVTRTVLFLPAVTKQYSSIVFSTRSILSETRSIIDAVGPDRVQRAVADAARAEALLDTAAYDKSIYDARANAARARVYAATARAETAGAAVVGLG